MSFEIARKFLVHCDAWQKSAIRHTKIRQAYLDSTAKISIRVRIKDDSSAILTLKSRSSKLSRREFEYAIPTLDAEELISLRRSHIIEKVRHIVPYGNLNWEVDVFSGENQGLVVAEIELPDENHQIELTKRTLHFRLLSRSGATLIHEGQRFWAAHVAGLQSVKLETAVFDQVLDGSVEVATTANAFPSRS
jgi:adenylate cyclase